MKQFDEQKMVNMSDEELLGFIGGDSIRDVSPTFNKIRRWFDGLMVCLNKSGKSCLRGFAPI